MIVFLNSLFAGAINRLSNQRDHVRVPAWPHDGWGCPQRRTLAVQTGTKPIRDDSSWAPFSGSAIRVRPGVGPIISTSDSIPKASITEPPHDRANPQGLTGGIYAGKSTGAGCRCKGSKSGYHGDRANEQRQPLLGRRGARAPIRIPKSLDGLGPANSGTLRPVRRISVKTALIACRIQLKHFACGL